MELLNLIKPLPYPLLNVNKNTASTAQMALTGLRFVFAFLTTLIAIAAAEYATPITQYPVHVENHQPAGNGLLGGLLGGQNPVHTENHQPAGNGLLGGSLVGNLLGGNKEHNNDQKPQGTYVPTEPNNYEHGKPYYGQYPNIDFIGIQGYVMCKSEANGVYPLRGATVEITCQSSYENGYNNAPYKYNTILHTETDEKGYYRVFLPIAELANNCIDLKYCKAYPKYSPLETCNIPAYSSSTGLPLYLLRTEDHKAYYTSENLIYTPNTYYPVPNKDPVAYESNHPVQNGY